MSNDPQKHTEVITVDAAGFADLSARVSQLAEGLFVYNSTAGILYLTTFGLGVMTLVEVGGPSVVSGTPDTVAKFVTPGTVGDSQITDDGSAINASAATTATLSAGTDVIVIGVDSATVQSSAAGSTAVVQALGAGSGAFLLASGAGSSAGVGAAGANGAASVSAEAATGSALLNAGAAPVFPAAGFAKVQGLNGSFINGILFLGSTNVAGLAAGIFVGATQAVAFVTNMKNLDSLGVYPAVEAVGTGGLAIRGTDGVWRLSGTNIVAS